MYFKVKGKSVVFACDKWDTTACNAWAIKKHIEALRGQERWGIGTVEQAFTGYFQLPPPMVLKPWYEIFEVAEDCTFEEAQGKYRKLAKRYHPDNGGSTEQMSALNAAYEEVKQNAALPA